MTELLCPHFNEMSRTASLRALKMCLCLVKIGFKWHTTDTWAKYSINNKNHLLLKFMLNMGIYM